MYPIYRDNPPVLAESLMHGTLNDAAQWLACTFLARDEKICKNPARGLVAQARRLACRRDGNGKINRTEDSMELTERYGKALSYIFELQGGEKRKGTAVSSMTHFLSVSALVMEYGGSEDEAIAALLHDAVEDCGGRERADHIRGIFGDAVADTVLGCSDSLSSDKKGKAPWLDRKRNYIEALASEPSSVILVSCADKLHNVRSILADYRLLGGDLWNRFVKDEPDVFTKKRLTLWYYRSLLGVYVLHGGEKCAAIAGELERALSELERISS
jgi:hypothetical protein